MDGLRRRGGYDVESPWSVAAAPRAPRGASSTSGDRAGDSEIDELFRIFRVRGTPNDHVWPGVSRLPNYKSEFPQWHPQRLERAVPELAPSDANGGPAACDLMAQMLTYAPAMRVTCRKALEHPFFQPPRLDKLQFAASTHALG